MKLVQYREGSTRMVLLVGGLAIKLPIIRFGWRLLLLGLLANMQERLFWRQLKAKELCPVRFSLPGGWLVVMQRASPLSRAQFDEVDLDAWLAAADWHVPVEFKMDSFGWIDGRLVAIDYGS